MVTPHSKNQVPVIEGPSSRKAVIVFEGDLGALPLGEVVQMGCVGRQRFWIEVWSDGQQKGSIVLDGGEVVGASSEHHQGDEAFFALARVPHGRFRVYPASDIDRRALPPTSRSWHELLLETARLSDEDGRPPPPEDDAPRERERSLAKEKLGSWRPAENLPESGMVLIPPPAPAPDLMGNSAKVASEPPLPPEDDLPPTLIPPAFLAPPAKPTLVAVPVAALIPPPAAPSLGWISAPDLPSLGRISAPDLPSSGRISAPDLPASGRISTPGKAADEREPESPYEIHTREATEAYLRRDYAEALRLFELCLVIRPGDRRILHNIERLRNRTR